jgi:hypothetical protein
MVIGDDQANGANTGEVAQHIGTGPLVTGRLKDLEHRRAVDMPHRQELAAMGLDQCAVGLQAPLAHTLQKALHGSIIVQAR